MTRQRIAQIGENRNPKSPETRPQTRRFLQIRLLQLRRSATPFNGLAVLHGRLKGFPEAITAVFPQATVQTCIVHLLRHSLDFVSWKDRKSVAAALKGIYRAVDVAAGEAALSAFQESFWGQKYPAIGQSWRRLGR